MRAYQPCAGADQRQVDDARGARSRARPHRFNALRREVGEISQKVVSTLRDLEENGFISRTVTSATPPQVEYALTDLGHDLLTPVQALAEWVMATSTRMDTARLAYAARRL